MKQIRQTIRPTPKIFGSSYQPPRPKKPIRTQTLAPIGWLLLFLLTVVLLGRLPIFKIKSVELVGTDNQAIKNELNSFIGQSIFSRQIARINRELLNNNLNLSELDCQRGLPNTIQCQAQIRQPTLIWESAGQSFLVDQTGFIYADSTSPELLKVTDRANKPVALGSSVISQDLIKIYQQLADIIKSKGLKVEELFIIDNLYQIGAEISPDPNITPAIDPSSGQKLTVLFITTAPIPAQVDTLVATLGQKGPLIHEKIDLRVPGYVYFK